MLKLVSRAFKKRKKPAPKARKSAPTPSSAVAKQGPKVIKSELDNEDDLSLEDLEGMVVKTPQPKVAKPVSAPAPAPAPPPAPSAPPLARPAIARTAPGTVVEEGTLSPERQALLRDALAIQRAKKDVFDDLDDEAREKLYVMAMKALVDKDFGEK